MKTKNNVQKTVLRTAAVVVSFVLISFTVSAQGFWKKLLAGSSFNEIALAMVEKPAKTDATISDSRTNSFVFYEEYDDALGLENWMTNENHFGACGLPLSGEPVLAAEDFRWPAVRNLHETDSSMEIEDWMTDSKVWTGQ